MSFFSVCFRPAPRQRLVYLVRRQLGHQQLRLLDRRDVSGSGAGAETRAESRSLLDRRLGDVTRLRGVQQAWRRTERKEAARRAVAAKLRW